MQLSKLLVVLATTASLTSAQFNTYDEPYSLFTRDYDYDLDSIDTALFARDIDALDKYLFARDIDSLIEFKLAKRGGVVSKIADKVKKPKPAPAPRPPSPRPPSPPRVPTPQQLHRNPESMQHHSGTVPPRYSDSMRQNPEELPRYNNFHQQEYHIPSWADREDNKPDYQSLNQAPRPKPPPKK